MKMFAKSDIEYESQDDMRCYKALIREIRYTEKNHLIVECDNCCRITLGNDTVLHGKQNYAMNFIIPRIFNSLTNECRKELKLGLIYFFKLKKDKFSNKWVVSEVYE
jgi:hypothetical protein